MTEIYNLVNESEAARDIGITHGALAMRRKRDPNFPKPVTIIGSSCIYDVEEIREYDKEFNKGRSERLKFSKIK